MASNLMTLTSTAFKSEHAIGAKFTGIDADRSPHLEIHNVPSNAKTLALICDDPDAPTRSKPRPEGPWVHWVFYNLAPTTKELPEGVARTARPANLAGSIQGKNDFPSDNIGYRGPMPPVGSGPHRYYFHLFALDTKLDEKHGENMTKGELKKAMENHIIAEATLMGTFERK